MAAAHQLAGLGEQGGADGNAAFSEAEAGFLKRYPQHAFVQFQAGHRNPLVEG
jgi:hypothetical protein